MTRKEVNTSARMIDPCTIPKWQHLRSTLENLEYTRFVDKARSVEDAVILDVRKAEEYEIDHLEGAINLDYLSSALADDIDALDKSKTYFVYCRTGRRSVRICILLRNSGFKKIYNLEYGLPF